VSYLLAAQIGSLGWISGTWGRIVWPRLWPCYSGTSEGTHRLPSIRKAY